MTNHCESSFPKQTNSMFILDVSTLKIYLILLKPLIVLFSVRIRKGGCYNILQC